MYYLITGYLSINDQAPQYVREIANQPSEEEARKDIEQLKGNGLPTKWVERPGVVELPADQFMRHVAGAQELPGLTDTEATC